MAVQAQITASTKRFVNVPFRKLRVGAYNPRKNPDPGYILEMAESIKAQGVIQSPVCREVVLDGEDIVEIVVGQCRFLGSEVAFGEDGSMDVEIRELTDDQAVAMATTENIIREDMSEVEEAEAAAQVLGYCEGDRDEAAKRLGWTRTMLDGRLKLMACSDEVRKRLAAGLIKIGIAELLAGLPKARQDECLNGFDANGKVPTVEAFKASVQQLSKQLNAAIFDKEECLGCPHNSAQQRQIFATGLDEGYCLNSTCYDKKTEGALQVKADALAETYPVVRIVRAGDNFTCKPLQAEGAGGVGAEQAAACRSCKSFGAAVSALPDKIGMTVPNLCFDVPCNDSMVASRKAKEDEARAAAHPEGAADAGTPQPATKDAKARKAAATLVQKKSAKAEAQKKKTGGAQDCSVGLTNAVLEFRDKLYNTVIATMIAAEPTRGHALLIALAAQHRLSAVDSSKLSQVLNDNAAKSESSTIVNVGDAYTAAMTVGPDRLQKIVARMAATATVNLTRSEREQMVLALAPDWNLHFVLNADFLSVLTKSEMLAVASDLGLLQVVGMESKALLSLKKDELVKKLLAVADFVYQGAIPNVLKPEFKAKK